MYLMSSWWQAVQGTLCFLLSHAGHPYQGKTPGPIVTIHAAPCTHHLLQPRQERELGAHLGAQPLPRRSQGMLDVYLLSIWHQQYQCFSVWTPHVHVPVLCKRSFHTAVLMSNDTYCSNSFLHWGSPSEEKGHCRTWLYPHTLSLRPYWAWYWS